LNGVAEAGLQIEIPDVGPPVLVGITPLLSKSGAYCGSRLGAPEDSEPWADAIPLALEIAARVQSQGYFGPLGIDVMRYRDAEGQLRLRALQDLNARLTMGRLALGLIRQLTPGECATWLHRLPTDVDRRSAIIKQLQSRFATCRLMSLSPDDPSSSLIVIAPSAALRDQVEQAWTIHTTNT